MTSGLKAFVWSVALMAAVTAGLGLERWVLQGADPWHIVLTSFRTGDDVNRKILYWVAPMDPSYRRDGPGKSPMGMDLIPVYEEDGPAETGLVRVDAATAAAIGVRVVAVRRETLTPRIRTFGRVAFDEDRTQHVHVRANGWVSRLEFRREGERVRKSDLLFAYFSPELSLAAMEYARELERDDPRGIHGTRLKLRSLGVSDRQLDGIRPGTGLIENILVYAPQDGIISAIDVAQGMFITPDTTVFSLTDLSRVWVLAELLERDALAVRPGMKAWVEAAGGTMPTRTGVVDAVFPTLKEDTRTVEIRLLLNNPDGALLPNALTRVIIEADPITDVLTVPVDAVIRLAEEARVIRVRDEGRFEPVNIVTGPRIGDRMVIEGGLDAGDRIVAAAHFLIDSEGSLQAGMDRIAAVVDGPEGDGSDAAGGAAGDLVWATGEVVAVAVDRRVVTLDHAPVPELGWPGMVMDFSIGAGVSIDDLAPATMIHFAFVRVPDGDIEIRALHLVDAPVEQTDHAGHDNHHHHPDSPDGTPQR